MAEEQKDHTKFNMNSLLQFKNKEKDKQLSFGAYNGNIQLTMGLATFEKGVRPRSVTVTPAMAFLLEQLMSDIRDNPEPGKKKTLVFNGLWNEESKRRELSFQFTVGMDDEAMCYIGVKHLNREKEVFSGRFELAGDRNIEISGLYDDDKSRSFMTLRQLIHYFDRCVLSTGALFTRNHLISPSFAKNTPRGGSNQNNAQSANTGSIGGAGGLDEF